MKRIIILIVIASVTAGMLFAEEAILINFTRLAADIRVRTSEADQETAPNHNRRTVMDYGQVAGGSYTPSQRGMMRTSLAIEQWEVVFNSSARTIPTISNSFTREAPSRQWGTVMGVRIHFPSGPQFAKATIQPPFQIPAYEPMAEVDDDGNILPGNGNGITGASRFENEYGIVKNVGTIRSVAVNVYGLNFPHGLNVILIDADGNERIAFMGYLNFDGWAELTWNNPQYVFEVRDRDLRLYPLYPDTMPFVRFGGFRIDRDADRPGGDFITYFKDVKLIYDKAVLDTDRDINDEEVWGIINQRESERRLFEMERFGQNQILRFLEYQRQAREPWEPLQRDFGFTPTPVDE
ncbi:MAG: flagellar filament outer layer protein FlaA [Treponema sp.]|nr:flagellar filament outer layer protein FlaA [Treponema sp.]